MVYSDYVYDFYHFIIYLRTNSLNFNKFILNKKEIKKFYKVKTVEQFFNQLLFFSIKYLLPYGHNMPLSLYYNENEWQYLNKIDCYKNVFNKMYIKKNNKFINFVELEINKYYKNHKVYEYKIIKNDKNEDVIYIKIQYMQNADDKEYNELKKFLIKNKKLKDIYIDIRNNIGGNPVCFYDLYVLIVNEILETKYNYIPCYYIYNEQTKPFIDYKLSGMEEYIKKIKDNKYVIYQFIPPIKVSNYSSSNRKEYIGFNGNINIIMNNVCFSSAQYMLDISQGNKRFTILGNEKSSGYGLYGSPSAVLNNRLYEHFFLLPNTKILCRMELFKYNLNKYLTIPDKPIPEWLSQKD